MDVATLGAYAQVHMPGYLDPLKSKIVGYCYHEYLNLGTYPSLPIACIPGLLVVGALGTYTYAQIPEPKYPGSLKSRIAGCCRPS